MSAAQTKDRYQLHNAAYKVDGYYNLKTNIKQTPEQAFQIAKAECLMNLNKALKDVEELTFSEFLARRNRP